MKFFIRIFIEGYETSVTVLKPQENEIIKQTLYEFIQKENHVGEIDLVNCGDPVITRTRSDFMVLNNKKFRLEPFGFHKKLEIQFDYVNDDNFVCNCCDIWCDGHCGTLSCGCIDVCRNRCGLNGYDSY